MNIKLSVLRTGLILLVASSSYSQQPLRDQGIARYRAGDSRSAIRALEGVVKHKETKTDAEAWNVLGLAYINEGSVKNGRKALERAVKLSPGNSAFHANLAYAYLLSRQSSKSMKSAETSLRLDPSNAYAIFVVATGQYWRKEFDSSIASLDKAISIQPTMTAAYILKSEVMNHILGLRVSQHRTIVDELELLKASAAVLEAGEATATSESDKRVIAERLESMKTFVDHYSRIEARRDENGVIRPASPEPGTTPYKILYQPRAAYTDRARSAGIQGSVRLVILLGADGKVKHILKLWGLGYGLDENAIQAARQIRFEPKIVNGKPAPVIITREYTFSIH